MTSVQPSIRAPRVDTALAILRIVVGVVFIAHGAQKLFVWGHPGVVGAFTKMGIPVPALTGWVVAIVEFFGGVALVLGAAASIAAALIAVDMLGAMVFVHLKNGFFLPMGAEFAFTLFGAAVTIMIAGPGAWSVDGALRRHRP